MQSFASDADHGLSGSWPEPGVDGEKKLLEPGHQYLVIRLSLLRLELLGSVAMEMKPWVWDTPILIPTLHLQPRLRLLCFHSPSTKTPHSLTPLGPA